MKKYQNWLETRLYSHHLMNLTKIRQQYAKTQHAGNSTPKFQIRNVKKKKHDTSFIFYPNQNSGITRKDSFQLQSQNSRMAQRILFVQPVVSSEKHKEFYNKYRTRASKVQHQQNNTSQREKCLSKFLKMKELKNVSWFHKYLVRIKKLSFSQNFNDHDFSTLWLELNSHNQHRTSDYIHPKDAYEHEFHLPFKTSFKTPLVFTVNYSKGLKYTNLGQFTLEVPDLGSSKQLQLQSTTRIGLIIKFQMEYEKIVRGQGSS